MFINSCSMFVAIFINLIEKDNDKRRKNIKVSRLEAQYMNRIKETMQAKKKRILVSKGLNESIEVTDKHLSKQIN